MKILLALLLTISAVTSWGCQSWGCKTVATRCWKPSCGLRSYLVNRDYFMYWWKPAVVSLKLVPSTWRTELAAAQAENAEEIDALEKEIAEVKADNEALANESRTEIASVRAELADAQAEIETVRQQAADEVAAAREELSAFKDAQAVKSLKWKRLNSDLRSDVDNLRSMLNKHKRDDLRSVVLWPSGCGVGCVGNYKYAYGIWTRLAARLERTYSVEWAGLPCSRRLRVMRTRFVRWCQPYPEPVRVRLLGYYDYLVAGRACSW